jgi:hypothetical protein
VCGASATVEQDGRTARDLMERKRDDIVRSVVLQLHTAIENILTSWITCRMLGVRARQRKRKKGHAASAVRTLLSGGGKIGFDKKLNLAVALKLISPKTHLQLKELNTLRNKCSHNWLLRVPVRKGRRPSQKKPPLLQHRGRDLHNVAALKD